MNPRAQLEAAIEVAIEEGVPAPIVEAAIALLDDLDGDPDLEDGAEDGDPR